MSRTLIELFQLNNPPYEYALVYAYTADGTGAKTSTLATLYGDSVSTAADDNPFKLDGEGKNATPIYHEANIICEIHGVGIEQHDTGVLAATLLVFQGTTAARPATWGSAETGRVYYDTDLNRPIWWDGTQWRYEDGSVIGG